MPAATLAGALALAACGGGSTPPAADPPPGIEPGKSRTVDGKVYTCAEARTENCEFDADSPPEADGNGITITAATPPTPTPPAPTAVETANALEAATASLSTLAGAADADGSALKTAREAYVKSRDAAMLLGVSADAQAYAQKVVDAASGLRTAVEEAEKAKTAAGTAKAALAASDPQRQAIDRAVTRADAAIRAAEALLAPGGGVSALAAEYSGADDGHPSPSEHADDIAERVHTALMTTPAKTAFANAKNVFADGSTRTASMMTFAQLFAGSTTPQAWTGGKIVNAISLEDEEVGSTAPSNPDSNAGGVATGYTYRGISGDIACRSDDNCTAPAANGEFGEGWYFYPTAADAYYTTEVTVGAGGAVTTAYEPAEFVEWGMWLTEANTTLRLNRHVGLGAGLALGTAAGTNYTLVEGTTANGLADEASYSGAAQGLSAKVTGEGDDAVTASGHFLADVSLIAEFGDKSTTLQGSVDSFRTADPDQGTAHVSGDWELILAGDAGSFADGTTNPTNVRLTGADGAWNAQAYGGDSNERPEGIFGGFNATFEDGAAVGAFHTEAD